jgi:tripartite-type tricarboxylate transporter receptor subunit TctC
MSRSLKLLICLAGAAWLVLPPVAHSQAYPNKLVRMIVSLAAGGGVDSQTRAVSQKLAEVWNQQVIVENRPGAGGNIGSDYVAKAAPDGYTLLSSPGGLAIAPSLYRKRPFDPRKDFAPIVQLTSTAYILAADPKLPATSVAALVALAKAQPGKLNFGSSGLGTASHLAGELFILSAGINLVHIPYKADVNIIPDIISGQVQMAFFPVLTVVSLLKEGRLRGLAISSSSRTSLLPELPTVAESGVRDFEYTVWVGIFAPAGTPRDIVNRINADTQKVVRLPDVRERMIGWGLENPANTADEFSARYLGDIEKYAKVIKAAKIPPVD